MSLTHENKGPGRHGVTTKDRPDPMGRLVLALNKLASSDLLDRYRIRRQTEQAVFTVTRGGFRAATSAGRTFAKVGSKSAPGDRPKPAKSDGMFDLTPSEDEQMLVDVVRDFADEVLRPAASEADDACLTTDEVLGASREIGVTMLGVPESQGGIFEERSAMAAALVTENLARGDMGQAVAVLAPGAVATAISLYGTEEQEKTYLPAFTGEDVAGAALALAEPRPLFDPLDPQTTARRQGSGYVLDGEKSMVVRGAECELFLVGASLDGKPALFLVESGAEGLTVEADPSMGLRAASLTKLRLSGVTVGESALLGDTDGTAYRECVRLSRLAWCALAVGTAQAVLDYVTPYVKEREAFGEPISHRQSVAFMVANIAIELESMRLLTWKAASRAAAGKDFSREAALARKLCGEKAMQIGLDGVQLLGGHGFVKEHPVERWYRDLRAISLAEGGVLV